VANKEFDCTDNSCIDFSLRCNDGMANCKLRNDEEGCDQNVRHVFAAVLPILAIIIIARVLVERSVQVDDGHSDNLVSGDPPHGRDVHWTPPQHLQETQGRQASQLAPIFFQCQQ